MEELPGIMKDMKKLVKEQLFTLREQEIGIPNEIIRQKEVHFHIEYN